jgi:hypothetical protein
VEDSVDKKQWVYEPSADGLARFVLGTVGENPLVCFGINPSTATPSALDRTVARVSRFAADNGYDSWTMLNVYPQISTDPKGLDRVYQADLKTENERTIARLLGERRSDQPRTLLAAWGGLIESRAYLPRLLRDIVQLTANAGCDWVSLGQPTQRDHPRHPLYVKGSTPFKPFSADRYVQALP